MDPGKQQQVVALGRLGWSLRRIEAATGVRRETVSGYLKAAGVAVRGRLLHHAHVLKSGPRSWRTKIHTDLRSEAAKE